MKRAVIVYESVYGNTKRLAETICNGIVSAGVECTIRKTGEIHTDELTNYDAILLGAPNHNQAPAMNLTRFIDRASIVVLNGRMGAVFDTHTGGNRDVAAVILERLVAEKLHGLELIGRFSAKVEGRRGPVAEEDLTRAREFGVGIARALLAE